MDNWWDDPSLLFSIILQDLIYPHLSSYHLKCLSCCVATVVEMISPLASPWGRNKVSARSRYTRCKLQLVYCFAALIYAFRFLGLFYKVEYILIMFWPNQYILWYLYTLGENICFCISFVVCLESYRVRSALLFPNWKSSNWRLSVRE